MSHKQAVLIGVGDDLPDQRLQPAPTLAAMSGLLEQLGGWTTTILDGPRASRDGILKALENLIALAQSEPVDACLIHYFGHGSVVRLSGVAGVLGQRPVFYVAAARPGPHWSFEGVLDVELSLALARLDRICGNVSVILDCCKSSRTVRGDHLPTVAKPDWLPELPGADECDRLLDVESHPTIVRLCGSSAMHVAYGIRHSGGDLGLLTAGFIEVVRAADYRVDRLTWDSVVHRVRESAIRVRNGGEQWISLAGPRQRLVFSKTEVSLPRTVGYLPAITRELGWLRAGALQGVEVGDEWAIGELTVDEHGQPRILARVRVDEVDLGRARVVATMPECRLSQLPVGASAYMIAARDRLGIAVAGADEVGALELAIASSALLRIAGPDDARVLAKVSRRDSELAVAHADGDHRIRVAADAVGELVELLTDWARVEQLQRIVRKPRLDHRPEREGGFTVEWGWYEGPHRRREPADASVRLQVGDRVWFELRHRGRADWFIAAIEIGIEGRARLLNAAEPDGIALLPGMTRRIGERLERREQGMAIEWPTRVPRDRAMPVTVLFLASQRPMELGHLVRTQPEIELLRSGTSRGSARRSVGGRAPTEEPEPVGAWTWQSIRYTVEPGRDSG